MIRMYIDRCCEICCICVNFALPRVVSAHLIVQDRAPDLLNEVDHFLRVHLFIKESFSFTFVQYGLCSLFNFLQSAKREIRADNGASTMDLPGEFFASLLLLQIDAICNSCEVIFQLLQPRGELSSLRPDTFELLEDCQWQIEVAWNDPTSQCLMSALIPPRAALRGGNQSDDSFAMSKSILTPSTVFCAFPAGCQGRLKSIVIECAHPDPGPIPTKTQHSSGSRAISESRVSPHSRGI